MPASPLNKMRLRCRVSSNPEPCAANPDLMSPRPPPDFRSTGPRRPPQSSKPKWPRLGLAAAGACAMATARAMATAHGMTAAHAMAAAHATAAAHGMATTHAMAAADGGVDSGPSRGWIRGRSGVDPESCWCRLRCPFGPRKWVRVPLPELLLDRRRTSRVLGLGLEDIEAANALYVPVFRGAAVQEPVASFVHVIAEQLPLKASRHARSCHGSASSLGS